MLPRVQFVPSSMIDSNGMRAHALIISTQDLYFCWYLKFTIYHPYKYHTPNRYGRISNFNVTKKQTIDGAICGTNEKGSGKW